MKLIKASYEIITPINGEEILKQIELAVRSCYKSEDKIEYADDGESDKAANSNYAKSARLLIQKLIKLNHEAMLEFGGMITVRFICDRGISHELVRHRLCNFAQESSRYCNYSTIKNKDIQLIHPRGLTDKQIKRREDHYWTVQALYEAEISEGLSPQIARGILPNSTKTEIVMTANLREWRHILKLRTAKGAHPQMIELMIPLQEELHKLLPLVF